MTATAAVKQSWYSPWAAPARSHNPYLWCVAVCISVLAFALRAFHSPAWPVYHVQLAAAAPLADWLG